MDEKPTPRDFRTRSWLGKFACAVRGVWVGVTKYGRTSYAIHLPAMLVVLALGIWRPVSWPEWYLLILCITIVLAAEMTNSALEALARAVTDREDPYVRDALDAASGVVLLCSLGTAVVGALILFG